MTENQRRKGTETSPSTYDTQSTSSPSTSTPASAKVAIPRLQSEDHGGTEGHSRESSKIDRTNHACEPCRTRKTKCSGERPICKHCRQFNITCVYADGKRDRAKRHQEEMEHKIAVYEALLTEAAPTMEPSVWSRFQRARLSTFETEDESVRVPSPGERRDSRHPLAGENARSASDASIDDVDSVLEDVTRDAVAQATGYHGKASELDWQRDLNKKENDVAAGLEHPQSPKRAQRADPRVSSMTYQVNHTTMPALDNPNLKLYEVPSPQTAQALKDVFFGAVYPSHPILPKLNFEKQLNLAYNGNFETSSKPSHRWRAIMNLVFAIGRRYLNFAEGNVPRETKHETFFARAVHLGLTDSHMLHVPDLQQIQIYALASYYLTITNHLNRAWFLSGQAMRSCVALGLQVEIKSSELNESSKEARYRLWWAVYGLEIMLSIMTGRPPGIQYRGFSTPLPVPYDEKDFDPFSASHSSVSMARFGHKSYRDGRMVTSAHMPPDISTDAPGIALGSMSGSQSKPTSDALAEPLRDVELSDSLYFIFRTRLYHIVHKVLEALYLPATAHVLWSQVQAGIDVYNQKLDQWLSEVPTALDFQRVQSSQWQANRNHLALLFYSARILTNRPCLCELPKKTLQESKASQDLYYISGTLCIESAMNIIDLLPQDMRLTTGTLAEPWRPMIHHVLSAVTVLTIALFYECRHVGKEKAPSLIREAKRGLQWLHVLSQEPNEGAERAWKLAATTLLRIGQRLQFDMSDVPLPSELRTETNSREPYSRPGGDISPYESSHNPGNRPTAMDDQQFETAGWASADPTDFSSAFSMFPDPVYGYIFSNYGPPDGYPLRTVDGGYTADTNDYLLFPTSLTASVENAYDLPSMSTLSTEQFAGAQDNMPMNDEDNYVDSYPPISGEPQASAPSVQGQMPLSAQGQSASQSQLDADYSTPRTKRRLPRD